MEDDETGQEEQSWADEPEEEPFAQILTDLESYTPEPPPPQETSAEAALRTAQKATAELRKKLDEVKAAAEAASSDDERTKLMAEATNLNAAVKRAELHESFAHLDDDGVAATLHDRKRALEDLKLRPVDILNRPLEAQDHKAAIEAERWEMAKAVGEAEYRRREALDAKMQAQIDGWKEKRAQLEEVAGKAAAQVSGIQSSLASARNSGDVEAELSLIQQLARAETIAWRTRKAAAAPLVKSMEGR